EPDIAQEMDGQMELIRFDPLDAAVAGIETADHLGDRLTIERRQVDGDECAKRLHGDLASERILASARSTEARPSEDHHLTVESQSVIEILAFDPLHPFEAEVLDVVA